MSKKLGTVYRLFDATGNLLYVGCSIKPLDRLQQHELKPWFTEVASVSLVHFKTHHEAAQAEITAIAEESPKYNVVGNPIGLADRRERRAQRERDARERQDAEAERRELEDNYYRVNAACTNCGQGVGWVRKGFQITERDCPRCGFKALRLKGRQAA